MAGRRTNLALLLLLAAALGTGFGSFAAGDGWAALVVGAHAAAGLGLLVLTPWKSAIVRRGLRRRHPGRGASVAFGTLVALALASGLAHATGLVRTIGPVTAMQVHVAAALASVPFGLWHIAKRSVRPRRTDLSRRTVIRTGALAMGSVAAYGALEGVIRAAGLPGRAARFTGSYRRGSGRPASMPVTQWLFDPIPDVDAGSWLLRIEVPGVPAREVPLEALDDMRQPLEATLDCTGGWFATQRWEGVPLDRLLPAAADGRSVEVRSLTGYARRYPLRDASRLWLATRSAGEPLSAGHGFPARIVAPGRRGFWWVKWVVSMRVSDVPWWWQPPFPIQ
jgi:hypothetical protein